MSRTPASSNQSGEEFSIPILLVEDEPLTRNFLAQILEIKFPFVQTHLAENGQVGLELFRQTRADVVLTDVSMPNMDGLQMAREIRRLNPDVYIIALTAYNDLENMAPDVDTLFTDFLPKPIIHEQLFTCIDRYIDGTRQKK